jgi:hypothetical protein
MPGDNLTPEQRGPIFPSLDGNTPGEQDTGTDISDQPLTPLSAPDMPDAAGTGSAVSSVPGVEGQQAPDDQTVAGADISAPAARKPRTAQDRIAQLTRRYRQEQDARTDLQAQLDELLRVAQSQQQEIAAIRAGRQAPAPRKQANEAADALGLAGAGEPVDVPITLDAVKNVVREVLGSHVAEERQRTSAVEQMRQAHMTSFKEAVEEMPELADERSQARQVFDELYRTSPISKLPDGPYQLALQVRGILADDARRGQVASPERKRQASVVSPSPSQSDIPDTGRTAAVREFQGLTAKIRAGDTEFSTYKRWRFLRDNLQRK